MEAGAAQQTPARAESKEAQVREYVIYVVIKQEGGGEKEQLERQDSGTGTSPQQVLKAWLEAAVREGLTPPKGEYVVITGRSIWRKTPKIEIKPVISLS